MSARKRGRLEKTWAKVFRERCLPLIDEEMFRPLYCEDNGAPCKAVRLVVAVEILRHLFDLTHEETQYHVDFDLRWHLALGLDPCDDDDYVSERTLRYFEAKLVEHELVGGLFTELTDQLLDRLGVKTGQQRLDTTHLLPNVARLSRLGLFCETHRVLLKALRREDASLLERLPLSLLREGRICAVCGIGNPEAFFETLEGLGAELTSRMAYPDHSAFPVETLPRDMLVVTTEKDAMRLEEPGANIVALGIDLEDMDGEP